MKQGDFTALAKEYIHRTGYSMTALSVIGRTAGMHRTGFRFADVGAGTGKLTENLLELGLSGYAVEPNDAMRAEGARLFPSGERVHWAKGSAEETGLPDGCCNWVLMGSSFHWTDAPRALREFKRILGPGGFFTAVWNPRDLERSPWHREIEQLIESMVPGLKRVSSGGSKYTQGIESTLVSTGDFEDVFFVEAQHEAVMTPERYLGAWRSVNDIQAQAGAEKWSEILRAIEARVRGMDQVVVPYKTRAWTARVKR